jgi:hypothetical protein
MYVAVALCRAACSSTAWGCACAPSASTRRRRHGRHQGERDAVLERPARRRDRRLGGTVFTIGNGIAFNKEMTGGRGFIASPRDLRPVGSDQGDSRGAAVRLRLQPAEHPRASSGRPVPSEFC